MTNANDKTFKITMGPQSVIDSLVRYYTPTVTPKSDSPGTNDTSIKPHIAIIVGSVIPSVLLISVLGFLSFRWLRRRRAAKEQGGPASDERGWNDNKPQLHSECVERPTFELEDSVPVVVVIAVAKERLEMAVNEPAAYEMPVGKGCPGKL